MCGGERERERERERHQYHTQLLQCQGHVAKNKQANKDNGVVHWVLLPVVIFSGAVVGPASRGGGLPAAASFSLCVQRKTALCLNATTPGAAPAIKDHIRVSQERRACLQRFLELHEARRGVGCPRRSVGWTPPPPSLCQCHALVTSKNSRSST